MRRLVAELDVALHVAPGVQLEGLEAEVAAHLDVALVLVHRRPGDRRGVGRHDAVVAAEHLVDRHPRLLRFHVPAQDVEHAERPHVDFLDAVDLPHQVPHALGQQRVLADELVVAPAHEVDHRIAAVHLDGAEEPAVGLHADHGLARLRAARDVAVRAGKAIAPDELRPRLGSTSQPVNPVIFMQPSTFETFFCPNNISRQPSIWII